MVKSSAEANLSGEGTSRAATLPFDSDGMRGGCTRHARSRYSSARTVSVMPSDSVAPRTKGSTQRGLGRRHAGRREMLPSRTLSQSSDAVRAWFSSSENSDSEPESESYRLTGRDAPTGLEREREGEALLPSRLVRRDRDGEGEYSICWIFKPESPPPLLSFSLSPAIAEKALSSASRSPSNWISRSARPVPRRGTRGLPLGT